MRRGIWITFVILAITLLGVFICNLAVTNIAASKLYSDPNDVPENRVGLVLGTSKYLSDGSENPFFTYRLQAAAELFLLGKITHVIVSGDNRMENYNEPREMQRMLVQLGVPADKIHFDFAGFRTL